MYSNYRFEDLIDKGPNIENKRGRINVGMLNANPFYKGIANLGHQAMSYYLMERDINIYMGFSDTIGNGRFINGDIQVNECDILTVSVPFEDTYLETLRMISKVGLPLYAKDRDESYPLVIGGGMAMINPIPLSPFFDVVIVGEGRETLHQICLLYENSKSGSSYSKQDFLMEISGIPGVYIPSHYSIEVDNEGYVVDFKTINNVELIESNTVLDLVENPIYSLWTSKKSCYEYDDYLSLMVAMGCNKKCPYCVVGQVQGAKDGRAMQINIEQVLRLALERYAKYGTKVVKLFFSSAFSSGGDEINSASLKDLLVALNSHGLECKTGSLNVKQADDELFELLKRNKQYDVTFAPETVEHLRPIIGKAYITDDKLFYLVEKCNQHSLSMKLYMLGGIPGETDRDTIMQAELINKIRKALRRDLLLEIHFNPVFTKAQTPLQHFATPRPEEIRRKFRLLRSHITEKPVVFVTVVNDQMAYYQPLLSLGDFNISKVLVHLHKKNNITENDWKKAFAEIGISDERYFSRKDITKRLPWQHIGYVNHDTMYKRSSSILKLEEKKIKAELLIN